MRTITSDFLVPMKTLLVNNIEGGYYHPDMLKDGRVKDKRYKNSGETMFGIDRKAGAGYRAGNPAAWDSFWGKIDAAGARSKWKWNYFGGNLEYELKKLSLDIIMPWFQSFSKKYLTPQAIDVIIRDKRLIFHFLYGTWNGPWWFGEFARKMNERVKNGETDTEKLAQLAIADRKAAKDTLISNKAELIGRLMGKLVPWSDPSDLKKKRLNWPFFGDFFINGVSVI